MDLLEGWLGQYVHRALTEALSWKIQTSQMSQVVENDRFEDDGSNLRVKSAERFLVQITKIDQATSPIQVWISDSQTHVKVTIATAAAEQFKRAHRKRITEGTLGAIFQLTNFEIVAQYYGPKKTKITMLIHELTHIGSDGSSAFGSPRPIECLEHIQAVLDELQTFRAKDASKATKKDCVLPWYEPSASSRPSSVSSLEPSENLSQAMFATQAPRPGSKKRSRAEADGQVLSGPTLEGRADARKNPAPNGSASNLESDERFAQKRATIIDSNTAPQDANDRTNALGQRAREVADVQTYGPASIDALAKQKVNLLNLLAGKPNPKVLELQAQNVRRGANRDTASLEKLAQIREASTEAPSLESPVAIDLPHLSEKGYQQSKLQPPENIGELGIVETSVINSGPRQRKSPIRIMKISKSPKRISLREIRIPKNQRDLLERPDAWLPPEPGQRAPTANVPISILEVFNNRVNRKANLYPRSQQQVDPTSPQTRSYFPEETADDDKNSEEGSDFDVPIPSSQWPPSSPDQPVLPPDSSVEALEQAQSPTSQIATTKHQTDHNSISNHSRSTRSSSTTSLSSASDMSTRRNPPRVVRAKLNSPDLSSSSNALLRSHPPRTAKSRQVSMGRSPTASSQPAHNDLDDQGQALDSDLAPLRTKQASTKGSQAGIPVSSNANSPQGRVQNPLTHSITESSGDVSTQISSSGNPKGELALDLGHQDGSFADRSKSSDLSPLDSESDLEMTLPHGLDKTEEISRENFATEFLPSTNPQHNAPIMQVKETPYINGFMHIPSEQTSSPTNDRRRALFIGGDGSTLHNAQSDDTTNVETSSADIGLPKVADDGDTKRCATVFPEGALVNGNELGQASPADLALDDRFDQTGSIYPIADHTVSHIEETLLPKDSIEEPQVLATQNVTTSGSARSTQDLKRKASEPLTLSPNVTKRRNRSFARATSDLGYAGSSMQGPPNIARQMRHEYLASIHKDNLTDRSHVSSNVSESTNPRQRIPEGDRSPAIAMQQPILEAEESDVGADGASQRLDTKSMVGVQEATAIHDSSNGDHLAEPGLESVGAVSKSQHQEHDIDTRRRPSNAEGSSIGETDAMVHTPSLQASEVIIEHVSGEGMNVERQPSQDVASHVDLSTTAQISKETVRDSALYTTEAFFLQATPQQDQVHEPEKSSPKIGNCENASQDLGNKEISTHVPLPDRSLQSQAENDRTYNPSTTAGPVSPDLRLNIGPTDVDLSDVTQRSLGEKAKPTASTRPPSLFDRFKLAYPEYNGNPSQFAKICSKLESLLQAGRAEHPSLWDDFIIRHRNEYSQYTSQCMEDALDPVPYERFYRDEIEELKYTKRIVTLKTLYDVVPKMDLGLERKEAQRRLSPVEAIDPADGRDDGSKKPQTPSETAELDPETDADLKRLPARQEYYTSRPHHRLENVISRMGVQQTPVNAPRPHDVRSIPEQAEQSTQSRSKHAKPKKDVVTEARTKQPDVIPGASESSARHGPRKVIDLTEDDVEEISDVALETPSVSPLLAKRSRRSLPWETNSNGDASGNLSKPNPAKQNPASSPPRSSFLQRPFPVISPGQPAKSTKGSENPDLKASSTHNNATMLPAIPKSSATVAKKNTAPPSQSNRSPTMTRNDESQGDEANTSYRMFNLRYKSITPGKGNSYANNNKGVDGTASQSTPSKKADKPYKLNPFSLFL